MILLHRTNHSRIPAILLLALAGGVLLKSQGCRAQSAAHDLRGRVTIDQIEPVGARLDIDISVKENGAGRWQVRKLLGLTSGHATDWFPIGATLPDRHTPLAVTVPGIAHMRVSLELDYGEGHTQSAQETADGTQTWFYITPHADRGTDLIGATQIYTKSLAFARQVAVPDKERPRRIIIADSVLGSGASKEALDGALQTLGLLGVNTVQVDQFGELASQVPEIAQRYGIDRFRRAVYNPPAYFSWVTDALTPEALDKWAAAQAELSAKSGDPPGKVALFHMADEPGWYYPAVLQQMADGPARLALFHAYLQRQGLAPADVGAANWDEVRPCPATGATDLAHRRLYYWSARYPIDAHTDAMRLATEALHRHFSPNMIVTSNWNNRVDRFYMPAPNVKVGNNPNVGPDSAMGGPDWLDMSRRGALNGLWTEDWFTDRDAELWSFYADVMRSACLGSQNEFGGYIVGRTLGGHPAGALLKALALVGHGAKMIEWYSYGPEYQFAGNGYSENEKAFGQIARADRIIGRAEELLYPGRAPAAKIAILLGGSSQMWDEAPAMPMYQREIQGLHSALTHCAYPVDFIDEDDISSGRFAARGYTLVYVTEPNVPLRAQMALRDWIQGGGTAVFSPGAAAADEYNSPCAVLDEARGITSAMAPHRLWNYEAAAHTSMLFDDPRFGKALRVSSETTPLLVTSGISVAHFAPGGSALVTHSHGRGQAISNGFWPGQDYYNSPHRTEIGRLPLQWNADLRGLIVAVPVLAHIEKPVELSAEVAEAARLDSPAGIAITLLNWSDEPFGNLDVTIRNPGAVSSVSSVQGGPLHFIRVGRDIRVSMELRDADILLLRR